MATAETIVPVNVPDRMEVQQPKKRGPAVSKRKAEKQPEDIPQAPSVSVLEDPPPDLPDMKEAEEALATASMQHEKVSKKAKVMSASIPNMAVGDVRKCLNQIRKAGSSIRENHLLWNGWPAGRFALLYLIGNYSNKKVRPSNDDDSAMGTNSEEGADEQVPDATEG